MTLQYKEISPTLKALDDHGQGQAVIVQLNTVDRDNDVTVPLAFGEQHVKVLFGHDWKQPAIGDARLYEHDNYVLADFALNLNMESGREVYESLKWDASRFKLQEWSYGFNILDHAFGTHEGKQVRFLKKIKAYEISPVVVGAGIGTGTLSLKSAQRYWPGGITPMKSRTEHLREAVTSTSSGLRHLHHIRRILGKSPSTAKVDEDFDTAMEHFESVLDLLNDPILVAVESTPVFTTTSVNNPKAVDTTAPVQTTPVQTTPVQTTDEKTGDDDTRDASTSGEKGGMPLNDEVAQAMRTLDQLTDRFERLKDKRAEVSPRYPNGRPLSAERLEEAETLITRLSRLKEMAHEVAQQTAQQTAEQQELHDMTERLKRLGMAV